MTYVWAPVLLVEPDGAVEEEAGADAEVETELGAPVALAVPLAEPEEAPELAEEVGRVGVEVNVTPYWKSNKRNQGQPRSINIRITQTGAE